MDEFEKNLFLQEEAYKNRLSRLTSYPTKLTIPVADQCDLKCIMCGFAQHPERYKLKLNEKAYQRLKVLFPYLQKIEVVGAELYPVPDDTPWITDRIVEWSRPNNHLKLYGFSHAMNIGPKRAIDIVDKFGALSISIDSHRRNIFESIRVGGDFERLLSNITRIAEEKKRRNLGPKDPPVLQFSAVIMQRNFWDLPQLVRLVSELGGIFLSIRPLQKDVEGKSWEAIKEENIFSDSEKKLEFLQILQETQEVAGELGITINNQTPVKITPVSSDSSPTPSNGTENMEYCDIPWHHFFVRSNGIVTFDFCSRKILGSLDEDSAEDIWNSKPACQERSFFIDGIYGHCYSGCPYGFRTGTFIRQERGLRKFLSSTKPKSIVI